MTANERYPHGVGFCACGCGLPTNIARKTYTARGWINGQPRPTLRGHRIRILSPAYERIMANLRFVDQGYLSPCGAWKGATNYGGYGKISSRDPETRIKTTPATHIVIWEHHHGVIPEGKVIDHLCCDPAWCEGGDDCPHRRCCEITHLALATPKENILRGNSPMAKNARKTHCPLDHPLSGDNLHVDAKGSRSCRICRREAGRRWRLRRAQKMEMRL